MKKVFLVFCRQVMRWWNPAVVPQVSLDKKPIERGRTFYSPRAGLHRKGERGERKMSN